MAVIVHRRRGRAVAATLVELRVRRVLRRARLPRAVPVRVVRRVSGVLLEGGSRRVHLVARIVTRFGGRGSLMARGRAMVEFAIAAGLELMRVARLHLFAGAVQTVFSGTTGERNEDEKVPLTLDSISKRIS